MKKFKVNKEILKENIISDNEDFYPDFGNILPAEDLVVRGNAYSSEKFYLDNTEPKKDKNIGKVFNIIFGKIKSTLKIIERLPNRIIPNRD